MLLTRAGVAIVEGIGSRVASAELTWLLIMASRRNLVSSENAMAQGRWQREPGSAVHNQDIGFLGDGKIVKRLASCAAILDAGSGMGKFTCQGISASWRMEGS